MFKFSKSSSSKLASCDPRLRKVMELAIKRSSVDFGIAEGHRSIKRQKELFDEGKSKIDGVTKKGKHNYNPSKAVDIFVVMNGKASWDEKHLCYLAGVIESCGKELGVDIRMGANWDKDGILIYDQNFIDLPHFEIA